MPLPEKKGPGYSGRRRVYRSGLGQFGLTRTGLDMAEKYEGCAVLDSVLDYGPWDGLFLV